MPYRGSGECLFNSSTGNSCSQAVHRAPVSFAMITIKQLNSLADIIDNELTRTRDGNWHLSGARNRKD